MEHLPAASGPNGPPTGLGLDAGGTETRWVAKGGAGTDVARGQAPALSGLVFTPEARQHACEAVAALADQVLRATKPAAIAAGVTGTDAGSDGAAFLRQELADAFGLPPSRVLVGNDLYIAYLAAFPQRDGILAYSGTGSAACYLDAAGSMLRVGGHGYLLDDGGSGYAIARDALRVVLRAEDAAPGSGWQGPLGRELAVAIGGSDWDRVRAWAYGGGRAGVAQAAPAVARAAEAGDLRALAVLEEAGRELGRLVALLRRRLGPLPARLAGRAGAMHPAILHAAGEACGGDLELEQADAAGAAARLAAAMLTAS